MRAAGPESTAHRQGDVVLLVDDSPDILEVYGAILEDAGYTIHTAISGAQAITDAPMVMPDLILLDLMMPGTGGVEVCTTLRSRRKTARIPIIFLSAANETHARVQGLEAGGDDFIVKGVDIEELLMRMVAALRRSRAQPPTETTEETP